MQVVNERIERELSVDKSIGLSSPRLFPALLFALVRDQDSSEPLRWRDHCMSISARFCGLTESRTRGRAKHEMQNARNRNPHGKIANFGGRISRRLTEVTGIVLVHPGSMQPRSLQGPAVLAGSQKAGAVSVRGRSRRLSQHERYPPASPTSRPKMR
jgi:hypothetical protein